MQFSRLHYPGSNLREAHYYWRLVDQIQQDYTEGQQFVAATSQCAGHTRLQILQVHLQQLEDIRARSVLVTHRYWGAHSPPILEFPQLEALWKQLMWSRSWHLNSQVELPVGHMYNCQNTESNWDLCREKSVNTLVISNLQKKKTFNVDVWLGMSANLLSSTHMP